MEASMAASSRGAMIPNSSFRNKEIAHSRANLRKVSSQFCDRTHMQSYQLKACCGAKKEKLQKQKLKGLEALYDGSLSEKRRIKLLELVSKDLSALSTTFVEGGDAQKSLAEEVRGQIFSEALQVLMAQLEQVKAERKQRKKEEKDQKKALKAQKKMQKIQDDDTSSSESSDSECETATVTQMRMTQPVAQLPEAKVESPPQIVEIPLNNTEPNLLYREFAETANRLGVSGVEMVKEMKRVEVCMGGKCKKSGSEQLLAAFQESITKSGEGCRIEAVGCKCMGKCRSAPNVKVQSDDGKELHMSVEVGNVDSIVDRHFPLQQQDDEIVGGSLVSL